MKTEIIENRQPKQKKSVSKENFEVLRKDSSLRKEKQQELIDDDHVDSV